MKKLLEQLRKQRESTEGLISGREEFYYNKLEKWQESESGQQYETKTEELEDVSNSIEECIDNIEIYLGI